MCGIAGVYNYKNNAEVNETDLTSMREVMLHRGPDSGNNWISSNKKIGLAHRRLSIVDLSSSASQPMYDKNQKVILIICLWLVS